MGIIGRQSARVVFFSYLGTAIGFLSVGILYPKLLTPSQIGLINLIIALSLIFGQIGTFGFPNVINKMFTYFRDKSNKHHGFPFLIFIVMVGGTIVSVLLIFLLKDLILKQNADESNLLYQYYYLLIPASFAVITFNLFEAYSRSLYDAVIAVFYKEFLFRVLVLILIGAFAVFSLSFHWFIQIYIVLYIVPSVVLIIVLSGRKAFHIKPEFAFLNKALIKSMTNVSIYALVGGFGSIAIASIDKIMINKLLGLAETGIYSIAFIFGTIFRIPSSALAKSSYGIVADAWKNNDLELIKLIYHKSCLNQLIAGLYIFLVLWLNIDYLFDYLPPAYAEGKYVILLLSIAQLFNMATGINNVMLMTSEYYKFHTYLTIFLLVVLVITNLIFIPLYGITGAALGSAITLFLTNLIRYILFLIKYKMQPYGSKFIVVLLAALVAYIGVFILPEMQHEMLKIMINVVFITIVYGCIILITHVSQDLNNKMQDYVRFFKQILFKS